MDNKITLIASTTLGLESVVKNEVQNLGFDNIKVLNGKVEFEAKYNDIPKANIFLRCADRVFLKLAEFKAITFEDLFQGIYRINWQEILPEDARFPISWISSVKSKLFSKSACQSIIKKAIIEKMKLKYDNIIFSEKGSEYKIKIQINNDIVVVAIDTSGEPLFKRGYKRQTSEAPIKETLACGILKLSNWDRKFFPLIDPMCGSGTIVIEAALMALNIAPGANRRFVSESWDIISQSAWIETRDLAYSNEKEECNVEIYASDININQLEVAIESAKTAGVLKYIKFSQDDFNDLDIHLDKGSIITNPPYGERLLDIEKLNELYKEFGNKCKTKFRNLSYYVITPYEKFQQFFGMQSTKNRKLYNGGIKCYFHMYYNVNKTNRRKND